jgi:hypothetical protein
MGGKNMPRQGQQAATIKPVGMAAGSMTGANITVTVAYHD